MIWSEFHTLSPECQKNNTEIIELQINDSSGKFLKSIFLKLRDCVIIDLMENKK